MAENKAIANTKNDRDHIDASKTYTIKRYKIVTKILWLDKIKMVNMKIIKVFHYLILIHMLRQGNFLLGKHI